jgi:hypothetical protein
VHLESLWLGCADAVKAAGVFEQTRRTLCLRFGQAVCTYLLNLHQIDVQSIAAVGVWRICRLKPPWVLSQTSSTFFHIFTFVSFYFYFL